MSGVSPEAFAMAAKLTKSAGAIGSFHAAFLVFFLTLSPPGRPIFAALKIIV
jgi:hypothetical protein